MYSFYQYVQEKTPSFEDIGIIQEDKYLFKVGVCK